MELLKYNAKVFKLEIISVAPVFAEAIKRINLVIENFNIINVSLDGVMEGWRLKRLPCIDQDILRLAYIDLYHLKTPIPVTCNEAVNLANRYSDEQGRKMINGVLRRLQENVFEA